MTPAKKDETKPEADTPKAETPVEEAPEPDPTPEPDSAPDPAPADEPSEDAPTATDEQGEGPAVDEPEVGKADIRVGDLWTRNTTGEQIEVVSLTADGDPVIAPAGDSSESISAEELTSLYRHDGPTHR